jgi:biotin carboxyl carrier protein
LAELMREVFRIADAEIALFLTAAGGALRMHLGGESFAVGSDGASVTVDGAAHAVAVAALGDRLFVHLDGAVHEISYLPAAARQDAALSASDHLVAPMPGAVVACAVKAGDTVAAGDLLLVIESMKLETPFKAWRAGRVESVHVGLGQTFERDRVLLSLEAA